MLSLRILKLHTLFHLFKFFFFSNYLLKLATSPAASESVLERHLLCDLANYLIKFTLASEDGDFFSAAGNLDCRDPPYRRWSSLMVTQSKLESTSDKCFSLM